MSWFDTFWASLAPTPTRIFDPHGLNAALAARRAARPARQEAAKRGAVTRRERVA